jgi:integrase
MVELAIETAMRRGELLPGMAAHRPGQGRGLPAGDQERDPRYVPLTPKAVAILRAWPKGSGALVFGTTENAFKLAWQRAVKRAKLPDLHFHDLRHEAASRLAELSNVLELSSVTGHKDLRMLKRYYHPRPGPGEEAGGIGAGWLKRRASPYSACRRHHGLKVIQRPSQ